MFNFRKILHLEAGGDKCSRYRMHINQRKRKSEISVSIVPSDNS